MATLVARGQRRASALERIERSCQTLVGGESLRLPTTTRYGTDMLLIFQLEAIADYLESAASRVRVGEPVAKSAKNKTARPRSNNVGKAS